MHSIRVKITAITLFAILTSIFSVILASNYTIHMVNERTSVETMNLIGQSTKKSVEKYLESIEQSVEMAANLACDTLDSVILVENGVADAYQSEPTPEQTEQLDAYLHSYCDNIQEAFTSVASHTHGIVTYYYCIDSSISTTEHGFFYSRVGKTGFHEQEPLDARDLDPEDIEHTTWYYTPIERGRPSWVGPYKAHFLEEMWTYSYLVPIYKAGVLIGVLGMDIPFDIVTDLVGDIQVYDTGYACLFDAEGNVLYHPEMESGNMAEIFAQDPGGVFQEQDSGDRLIRYTVDGQERRLAFTTLSNGLKLVITAPEKEISAAWSQLAKVILVITALIVVIFSILLLLAMSILTRPLERLTAASQRLADGDYDVELNYESQDEVGALTKAFKQMRDHLKGYIADLNRRIDTDELTGLPNMRHFFRLAEAERVRLQEIGKRPVMLYFNLIGMKFYNRQYGFQEGDKLIQAMAEILSSHYGDHRMSRYGHDQFTAITDEDRLEEELQAVLRECEGANGGNSLPVRVGVYPYEMGTVSVSVACDRAKYACDRHGGAYVSGYSYFGDTMLRQVENTRYIINRFDQAVAEGWIQVWYQPIIRAANGMVCDEEALARWIDPEKGTLSPGEFIPVLEDAKLIYKLDLYVLEQVLVKMQAQKRAGMQVVPHSLNLSRVDFDACDIVEEICCRVDAAGIPREKLTIEVTESTVGGDFDFMKEQILRFQALGFPVWMDDFGSGYSSLDVLQDIHFDLLKFDMRFMQRFEDGDESKIILTELIKMAIGLGIDTVAEGVETKEQLDFLREVGCTKLQGYYYCRPIPLEEIEARYARGEQIGYENLAETGYYTAIGRINLYDLASVASDGSEKLGNFFDTLPMAVIESDGKSVRIVRCNKSYRDFIARAFGGVELAVDVDYAALLNGPGGAFAEALAKCRDESARVFIHEDLGNGFTIHSLLRHVAANPVTGIFSCVAVILGLADGQEETE